MSGQTIESQSPSGLWALEDLPPFPWIATKVLQLFAAPEDDLEVRRLIELIRSDTALSAELLRRANSALFGLKSQISSLQHAVTLLGLDQVRTLALTIGLGSYLHTALKLSILRRCWRHSLASALLAEEFAPACSLPPDQSYTAGLLHDVGRLALLVKYPQPYADLLSVVIENRFAVLASEQDLFDVDHCQAGAWLAEKWEFPPELRRVAELHHNPPVNGSFDLVRLVNLACRLSDSLGFAAVEATQPEDPVDILGELPQKALSRIRFDVLELKETLTRKLNALE